MIATIHTGLQRSAALLWLPVPLPGPPRRLAIANISSRKRSNREPRADSKTLSSGKLPGQILKSPVPASTRWLPRQILKSPVRASARWLPRQILKSPVRAAVSGRPIPGITRILRRTEDRNRSNCSHFLTTPLPLSPATNSQPDLTIAVSQFLPLPWSERVAFRRPRKRTGLRDRNSSILGNILAGTRCVRLAPSPPTLFNYYNFSLFITVLAPLTPKCDTSNTPNCRSNPQFLSFYHCFSRTSESVLPDAARNRHSQIPLSQLLSMFWFATDVLLARPSIPAISAAEARLT